VSPTNLEHSREPIATRERYRQGQLAVERAHDAALAERAGRDISAWPLGAFPDRTFGERLQREARDGVDDEKAAADHSQSSTQPIHDALSDLVEVPGDPDLVERARHESQELGELLLDRA
jgi:hypothetical protein